MLFVQYLTAWLRRWACTRAGGGKSDIQFVFAQKSSSDLSILLKGRDPAARLMLEINFDSRHLFFGRAKGRREWYVMNP